MALAANLDASGLDPVGDSVPDRILNQGLQDQIWRQSVQSTGSDIERNAQALLKAGRFDVEVTAQEFELLRQRHFLILGVFEGEPQEVAEASHHAVRSLYVFVQERSNGVQ